MAGSLMRLRAVAGIQARLSSTRMPGKVLADLAGRPLIQRVVERVRAADSLDLVVVLTSDDPSDDPLCDTLRALAIPFRRGPLADVRARYLALLEELDPVVLVRVTGDCPLVAPHFINAQVRALDEHDADFVWIAPGGVEGTLAGQGALSARALRLAAESTDELDREHVGSFLFRRQRARFRHVELAVDPAYRRAGLRLCVDEAADLALVRRVFERFVPERGPLFPLAEAIAWLDRHPEVRALNAGVVESQANRAARALERADPPALVGRASRGLGP
jgi:spore coat polysaccharide biosynthesis protein SpsF (cytidylyltransferase family)